MAELTETDLKAQLLETELKLQASLSDFNKQRSKFKEILLTQESELKLQQDKIETLTADNQAYQQQLQISNMEHSESIEMLKLSQSMDEQEYNQLRNTQEQEQASLRQSFHLQLQEYQAQLQLLSIERGKWKSERNSLIQELSKLKSSLDTANKAKPSLEDEMSRAQEESSKLKNVVLPLEREIASLKQQLEQSSRQAPQAAQKQDDLINLHSETRASPRHDSDGFLNTILSSSDIDPASNVSAFDPLFENSSIGVVQQILDISQGSSEMDTKRESQDRIRGLEGEVRDCQLRCTKYEGLLDDLRAENYELTDKSATLTGHLSRINREMNKLKTASKKLKELLILSQVSLTEKPADLSQSDWVIVQDYLRECVSPHPSSPGDQFSLLTASPVKFKLQASDSRLCTTPELNSRLVGETDSDSVSILRAELFKAKLQLEEVQKEKRGLEEQVDSLQASRGTGPIETSQTQKQMTFLKVTVDQQKSSLHKERRLRTEMRKDVALHFSDLKSIEETYADKERELKELLGEMREELGIAKKDAQQQISALMNDREKLLLRIKQTEDEYSSLESRRQAELKKYSHQLNEEKFRKSEAEINVATLQEQLDVLQENKSKQHCELGSKLTDRVAEITQLQSEKDRIETTLAEGAEEVSALKTRIDQLITQLEIVHTTKAELLSENHRLETELSDYTKRTEQEITRLSSESKLLSVELQSKITVLEEKEVAFIRLKTELNTNEEVQRDFVRLSQRLQKQVAELEDERSVLRWDSEEETLQCRSCSQAFNMTRRKHRCRHCCSLFCHECSQWSAENHQKKEQRVCEACSKLLISSSVSKKKRASTSGDSK